MPLPYPVDPPRRPRHPLPGRWAPVACARLALAACAGLGLAGSAAARLPDSASFADASGPVVATPADIYGPLFRAVQLSHIFPDSKTFADAVPRRDPGPIMADFATHKPRGPTALRRFVLDNFVVPDERPAPRPPAGGPRLPLLAHIDALWPALTRQPAQLPANGSALPLPSAYVVPGGRFREVYYWDSYFTMLGLARDGRQDLVEGMIDDFTSLIERYGHIPNGTRTYYLSRSQPPVYYLMLGLSSSRDPALFRRRLAALRREHAYWMRGEDGLAPGHAQFHVARLPDGTLLNRYWDSRATPREESYAEDVATAAGSDRPAADVYRDLRAGAESGWDFSSRWLANPDDLGSIRTTRIAPVDLNSLMLGMERMIALACARIADNACTRDYTQRAVAREAALRTDFWDAREGRFADLDWQTGRPTTRLSAATLYPLFVGAARTEQAKIVGQTVKLRLLSPGGLRATAVNSGQQWDAPNGWAPLQWIAVEGLRRNGDPALARTIATRWLATVSTRYRASGKLVEKYDVERQRGGGGGEYPLQDGFGWTNGVTRALAADYPLPGAPRATTARPDAR
ncbi:alpha,alpha-trehalase TreF [Sphingomonas abietis]|uniref:Alpha,alpha-trehalase TreF n=1 Tax=Sphingomonas abietis TaxID=3012344 RepID=A0ABY7NK17_9SPHN|nr:alpha,alpha-trehalase TreF [Sphingomonas abietis]WBO21678.1 alpha,alpha-trehalase TreF [Sphingomonas abietis]